MYIILDFSYKNVVFQYHVLKNSKIVSLHVQGSFQLHCDES
jgi:hypothetical protein